MEKIEYYEAREPFLVFGNGTEAKVLKRYGEKDCEFLLLPTKPLLIMHGIKQEKLINGRALYFKCPNPDDNLIVMSSDPAFGKILCLVDIEGKETNVSRKLVEQILRERLKNVQEQNESLSLQLMKQQKEMNMIINNQAEWRRKQQDLIELNNPKRDYYDEIPDQ